MKLSSENRGGTLQRLFGIWELKVIVRDDTIRYDPIRKTRAGGLNSDVSAYVSTTSQEGLNAAPLVQLQPKFCIIN
jgi:hypothetical protein